MGFGNAEGTGCRIGVWGTFDLEDHSDAVLPRIVRNELGRRLPNARIRTFAPFGELHPSTFDAGVPPEPLGRWEPERLAQLATELDLVIVGAGCTLPLHDERLAAPYREEPGRIAAWSPARFLVDGLGADLERETAVIWSAAGFDDAEAGDAERLRAAVAGRAAVSVRGEAARRVLEEAGVIREIEVVPWPGLLASRLIPPDTMKMRLEYLRYMDWFPPEGPVLVVQADRTADADPADLAAAVEQVLEGHPGLRPVLVRSGRCYGDDDVARAIAAALPATTHHLPEAADAGDVIAAVAAAEAVVASSPFVAGAALAYDRPVVGLASKTRSDLADLASVAGSRLQVVRDPAGFAAALRAARAAPSARRDLLARLDAHFDALAEAGEKAAASAGRAGAARPTVGIEDVEWRLERLSRAYEVLAGRVGRDRLAFAERLHPLQAELNHLRREVRWMRKALDEAAQAHEELHALRSTKTFRYTAMLRDLYSWLRRRR